MQGFYLHVLRIGWGKIFVNCRFPYIVELLLGVAIMEGLGYGFLFIRGNIMSLPITTLLKKRAGIEISEADLLSFVLSYSRGDIPDYQMAAFCMATYFQGMTDRELAAWLKGMMQSGRQMSWAALRPGKLVVDKHSTGGVGDKTSLVVLPLLLAAGYAVPMVAGRGLGHTGGTIDKLEGLPGFNASPEWDVMESWMERNSGFIMAQSLDFVPADRRLYALRDVTGTVDSIPLIVSSIMSKKLAEDLDALILDVKTGNGAFMESEQNARELAQKMVAAGNLRGCRTLAVLTSMDQPLGRAAGNLLEVQECVDILRGKGEADTRDLSVTLAAALSLHCQGKNPKNPVDLDVEKGRLLRFLDNGVAWKHFVQIMTMQGVNPNIWQYSLADHVDVEKIPILPTSPGYVADIATKTLGFLLVELGAGRRNLEDRIDYHVGLTGLAKIGEYCHAEKPLAWLHCRRGWSQSNDWIARFKKSFTLSERQPSPPPKLVIDWIV